LVAALDRLALLVIGQFERPPHLLPARHGPHPALVRISLESRHYWVEHRH
jgi:hypothetical protein